MEKIKKMWPLLFALAALVYLANPGMWRGAVKTEHIVEVTDGDFAAVVEAADSWVLVDFWAPWCGPCRAMMPELDAVAADYAGEIKFVKVNIDENPALAERFHIQSIPHVYLFKEGKPVTGFLGYRGRDEIQRWIEAERANYSSGSPSET